MEQSICILYIYVGVLFCRWGNRYGSELITVLLVAIVLNNSVNANIFYYHINISNEKSYATAVEMVTRMHVLDDGNVKNIAIIGNMEGYNDDYYLLPQGTRQLGRLRKVNRNLLGNETYIALYLSNVLDFQLSYYNNHPDIPLPEVETHRNDPVSNDWVLEFPICDSETRENLLNDEVVKNMRDWPANDSVKVVGETIVIKLSDETIENK